MADMALLVAGVGIWSVSRLMRCGTCGVPMGLPQALYRVITFSEGCWGGCGPDERPPSEPPPPAARVTNPELTRRHNEIADRIEVMVLRQRDELRQAREALANDRDAAHELIPC